MREREAGQSCELSGSERFKGAVRAPAERQMRPEGAYAEIISGAPDGDYKNTKNEILQNFFEWVVF